MTTGSLAGGGAAATGFSSGFSSVDPHAICALAKAARASEANAMRSEGDYRKLLDKFGVRRTSPLFWQQSDTIHTAYELDAAVEYGLFDYNRLENR